MFVYSVLTEDS